VQPVGTISDSVLWVLAQSLIYAGSALGITVYIQSEIRGIKQKIRNENTGKSSEV
jgi:pilus assembly protein TadC